MKTSAAGRAAIMAREGKRLDAYRDSVGVLTVGVGHTGRMSPPPVTAGMRITDAQCDAYLAADLAPVEAAINSAVKVPISQNEFDALASLGFNVGASGLKSSSVIKRLNVGDVAGAADAFLNWAKPAVLMGRRRVEREQFLKPDAAVTADRAKVLATKAAATKAQAKTTGASAGALVAGGAVIAATAAPVNSHYYGVAAGIAIALVVAGLVAALVAMARNSASQSLAASAGHQEAVAAALEAVPAVASISPLTHT